MHIHANCVRSCIKQPVPRRYHCGEGFHYRVGYRPLTGDDRPMSVITVNDPNISQLVVYDVPYFQQYEIFVQSANHMGVAQLRDSDRKIGYSGEGCEYISMFISRV